MFKDCLPQPIARYSCYLLLGNLPVLGNILFATISQALDKNVDLFFISLALIEVLLDLRFAFLLC